MTEPEIMDVVADPDGYRKPVVETLDGGFFRVTFFGGSIILSSRIQSDAFIAGYTIGWKSYASNFSVASDEGKIKYFGVVTGATAHAFHQRGADRTRRRNDFGTTLMSATSLCSELSVVYGGNWTWRAPYQWTRKEDELSVWSSLEEISRRGGPSEYAVIGYWRSTPRGRKGFIYPEPHPAIPVLDPPQAELSLGTRVTWQLTPSAVGSGTIVAVLKPGHAVWDAIPAETIRNHTLRVGHCSRRRKLSYLISCPRSNGQKPLLYVAAATLVKPEDDEPDIRRRAEFAWRPLPAPYRPPEDQR